MSRSPEYLYDLLPQVHRTQDALQGNPLRALLEVVAEQVNVVEDDIAQLYNNWFIETCEDWVVPYIGDLVGYRAVPEAGDAGPGAPRQEVANTIRLRRRKGTVALLEDLARDVAAWPARAVQFYTLMGWTQHLSHLSHLRPTRGRTADLRDGGVLARLDGPFDSIAHTVGLRGRYNIPDVGLFVWRLKAYSVTHTAARCIKVSGGYGEGYTFSELGNDTPLYTRVRPESGPAQIAEEINVPGPIGRRAFTLTLEEGGTQASPDYYGPDASLAIYVQDWPCRGERGMVPAEDIIPADLSDWLAYRAPLGKVLVDPERGRMVFPTGQVPKRVWVRYHYGFSADMGGGEYPRKLAQPAGAKLYRVRKRPGEGEFATVAAALAQWEGERAQAKVKAAVIEIADSCVYHEALAFRLEPGESLQLRAANMARPILRLLDYHSDKPDHIVIQGGAASRFVLDGLLVAGCGIEVEGGRIAHDQQCAPGTPDLCDITIRHCTLVPGWELDCDCEPQWAAEPSLTLRSTGASVRIERSILGPIRVLADETRYDPLVLRISDSILDSAHEGALAIGDERCGPAFAVLHIARTTVIGGVKVHAVHLAENSIFMDRLQVARRQGGCVRFCYVTPGSRTPARYRCQPDLAGADDDTRVRPRFTSLRYGAPGYCQLARDCAEEIVRGADDESEMGAFHHLYQPQRAASLRARLDEYTPAGSLAAIIYAS